MAPDGACEVEQSTARSSAHTMRSRVTSKGISKQKRKCGRIAKACSSNDFKRSMTSKYVRAMISHSLWLPSAPEQ